MEIISNFSMFLVPIFFFSGAVLCWHLTRETSALVMALGIVPTFVSLSYFWWGDPGFTERGGIVIPSESHMELSFLLGSFGNAGYLLSSIAFIFLIKRLSSHAGSGN